MYAVFCLVIEELEHEVFCRDNRSRGKDSTTKDLKLQIGGSVSLFLVCCECPFYTLNVLRNKNRWHPTSTTYSELNTDRNDRSWSVTIYTWILDRTLLTRSLSQLSEEHTICATEREVVVGQFPHQTMRHVYNACNVITTCGPWIKSTKPTDPHRSAVLGDW